VVGLNHRPPAAAAAADETHSATITVVVRPRMRWWAPANSSESTSPAHLSFHWTQEQEPQQHRVQLVYAGSCACEHCCSSCCLPTSTHHLKAKGARCTT
jgi:hypothetical protein